MKRRLWLCLVLSAATACSAGAAGFSIYEHGAAATATGGAFIARASDPTAVFYNPAGIARQKAAVAIGATLITPSTEFEGDNPFPGVGVQEKMKDALYYPPHAYLVAPVGPVTFGFGFFTPFGLGTEWDETTFSGRGNSTKAEIQSFYFNPVVAFRLGPLAVAGGVQAVKSTVNIQRIVRQPVLTSWLDVAKLNLDGSSGIGYGFNAGIQIKPIPQVTVGASYRSSVQNTFTGAAKFDSINTNYALVKGKVPLSSPANDVESNITFPAIMGIGIALKPFPQLTIEANLVQMRWSSFDSLTVTFTDPTYAWLSSAKPELYTDVRSYRIGAEFQVTRNLVARVGYLFDESPEPDAAVSTILPDADRNSYQIGIGYTLGGTTFDLAYMYLPFNDRSTEGASHDGFNGLYKTTAHLYGLTITQRF